MRALRNKGRVYRLPCHGRPRRREADGDPGKLGMDDFERQGRDISGEGASLKGANTRAEKAGEANVIGQPTVLGLFASGCRWDVREFGSGFAGTWQSMGCAENRLGFGSGLDRAAFAQTPGPTRPMKQA